MPLKSFRIHKNRVWKIDRMLRCVSTLPRLQLFSKLLGELQTYWYRQFALEKARCTKLVSQVLEITFNAPFAQLPTMRKGFPTLLGIPRAPR